MGDSRTSNKDVLDAIQSQTASIDKLVTALTAGAIAPAAVATPITEGEGETPAIEVPEGYLARMTEKAAYLVDQIMPGVTEEAIR